MLSLFALKSVLPHIGSNISQAVNAAGANSSSCLQENQGVGVGWLLPTAFSRKNGLLRALMMAGPRTNAE